MFCECTWFRYHREDYYGSVSLNDLRDIDSDNSYAVESEFSNSDNIQIIGTDSSNIA